MASTSEEAKRGQLCTQAIFRWWLLTDCLHRHLENTGFFELKLMPILQTRITVAFSWYSLFWVESLFISLSIVPLFSLNLLRHVYMTH